MLLEEPPREGVEVDEEDALGAAGQSVERQSRAAARPGEQPLDRSRDRRERMRRF
jgi:hypothetical protein